MVKAANGAISYGGREVFFNPIRRRGMIMAMCGECEIKIRISSEQYDRIYREAKRYDMAMDVFAKMVMLRGVRMCEEYRDQFITQMAEEAHL